MKKILVVLLVLFSSVSHALDCNHNPYLVGLYLKGGFFYDGKGIDVDLFKELKKRTGCEFKFVTLDRSEIWSKLQIGVLDIGTVGIPTPEREKLYYFITYSRQKNVLILNQQVDPKVSTLADLIKTPTLKFCTVKGYKHGTYYDPQLAQLEGMGRVERFPDQLTVFKMVSAGQCDAMLAYPISYNKWVRELGLKIKLGEYVPDEVASPNGLVLSKKSFTEAEAFQWREVIQHMRVDGTIYKLHLPYLKSHDAAISAGE